MRKLIKRKAAVPIWTIKNHLAHKTQDFRFRLKRVVKGKHWVLEDYYGINDDFNEVVERQYRHIK